jgi:capsular exopolysaccharide synthesis family protein
LRARQTLLRGLAVLRRHALVSLAIFIVVSAAGYLYVKRQAPTFRATAQLVIEKRTAAGRELPEAVSFMDEAAYSATQRYLLKHDDKLARNVLEKLGEEATPDRIASLLGGIKVEPQPGTLVVKLSFEGPDPEEALRIVNTYAEEYVKKNRDQRVDVLQAQQDEVDALYEAAAKREREAGDIVDRFRREHSDVAFTMGENPYQGVAQMLRQQATSTDLELIRLDPEEKEIAAVLERHGVRIERSEGAVTESSVRLVHDEGQKALERRLRSAPDVMGLTPVAESANVSDIRVRSRQLADEYHALRQEYREQHEKVRDVVRRQDENRDSMGAEVRSAIERYLRRIMTLRLELAEIRRRYDVASKQARETNELLAEYSRLTAIREAAATEARALNERGTTVGKALTDVETQRLENIRFFDEAKSAALVRPNKMLIYMLTGFAAVFLAIGAAVLLGYLDDTVKSKEDFDRVFGERLPFIGYVPRISPKEFERPDLVTLDHPQAAASESFRSVRTSILLSRSGRELQSLLITSASPGEGKTTVALNLAVTMARAGTKVLLIDADLRRSRVHSALGIDRDVGLTGVLAGGATLDEAIRSVSLDSQVESGRRTRDPVQLDVLTCGEIPPNPAELLGSPEMLALLEEAKQRYGKIILDTPPLVAVTDACVLSNLVDGVFAVISMGKTSWRLIRSGLEDLEKVQAPIRGAILNSLSSAGRGYYHYDGYKYRYYKYAADPEKKKREPAGTAS